jgi:hypothetical protein
MRPVVRIVVTVSMMIVLLVIAASCGSNPTSPAPPAVAGTWSGNQTLTQVIDGDCIGEGEKPFIGSTASLSLTITQTGNLLSGNIPGCALTGAVQGSTIALQSVDGLCQHIDRNIFCGNGLARDVKHVRTVFALTVTANQALGTLTTQDDVTASTTGVSVGTLTEECAVSLGR